MKESQDPSYGTPRPKRKTSLRGRPRNQETHLEILESTRRLAASSKSYSDISIEAISRDARVAKSTIYRRWKTKSDLIREACFINRFTHPKTGALQSDITEIICQEAGIFIDTISRGVFAGFVADYLEQYHLTEQPETPPKREIVAIIESTLETAGRRGERVSHLDPVLIADHIEMVVYYKCIFRGETITHDVAEALSLHALNARALTLPRAEEPQPKIEDDPGKGRTSSSPFG